MAHLSKLEGTIEICPWEISDLRYLTYRIVIDGYSYIWTIHMSLSSVDSVWIMRHSMDGRYGTYTAKPVDGGYNGLRICHPSKRIPGRLLASSCGFGGYAIRSDNLDALYSEGIIIPITMDMIQDVERTWLSIVEEANSDTNDRVSFSVFTVRALVKAGMFIERALAETREFLVSDPVLA